MNKIELLETRKSELLASGVEIRKKISALTDENSFVEMDRYSFSKNDFYDEGVSGDGVITGYATIDGSPVYVIAQNSNVLSGGVSYANCKKIKKCLDKAYDSGFPTVYLFDSLGVQVGEGVSVLEEIAEVLSASEELKGVAPQIAVVVGKLYGAFSLLAANCDVCYSLKGGEICYTSPLVISATEKTAKQEKVSGFASSEFNGVISCEAEDMSGVRDYITKFLDVLPEYSAVGEDTQDDLNRASENLNEKVCPVCLAKAVFDDGKFDELNPEFCSDVKTGVGRIGGVSVAAIIFGGEEKGVELDLANVFKIKEFAFFAAENSLPLVTFVNTLGIKADVKTNSTHILKEICNLITALKQNARLSVVYGKAIGLGYTLFASKALGVEYSFAFANAKIALLDGAASSVAFGKVREDKLDEFAAKYADENADPINAAKDGCVDNIIEPAFVRQYVISALQMMVK